MNMQALTYLLFTVPILFVFCAVALLLQSAIINKSSYVHHDWWSDALTVIIGIAAILGVCYIAWVAPIC